MMESQDFNSTAVPAGFWIRFVAIIIDSILVGAVYFAITFAMLAIDMLAFAGILGLIWVLGYYIYFPSSDMMGTPGKAVLGLKITDDLGNQISAGKATLRYVGYIINGFTLHIGFLIVGFTENKRGLHDMVASTRVTYK
tara:strand:- start:422 stop:838 length:417 start_codon:yes stop_codon:yes gene_type:complete